jgi:hypothetical protein
MVKNSGLGIGFGATVLVVVEVLAWDDVVAKVVLARWDTRSPNS